MGSTNGFEATVRRALDAGAAINSRNRAGETVLLIFARKDNLPMVELLISRGADVNQPNLERVTPLMAAARVGDVASAEALLDRGADPNAVNKDGWTALMAAAAAGPVGGDDVLIVVRLARETVENRAGRRARPCRPPDLQEIQDDVHPRPPGRRRARTHEAGEDRLAGRQRVAHQLGNALARCFFDFHVQFQSLIMPGLTAVWAVEVIMPMASPAHRLSKTRWPGHIPINHTASTTYFTCHLFYSIRFCVEAVIAFHAHKASQGYAD